MVDRQSYCSFLYVHTAGVNSLGVPLEMFLIGYGANQNARNIDKDIGIYSDIHFDRIPLVEVFLSSSKCAPYDNPSIYS